MRFAYFRVSTLDQGVEAQRHAMGGGFDEEFSDVGLSGAIKAGDRPGFTKLLAKCRDGDTVCVYAVDRLGRDALDVQTTVRDLLDRGVAIDVTGLGVISRGVGELILAVLAQVAEMERRRIVERAQAGRAVAKASLAATGKTHRGKASLGRQPEKDRDLVVTWRHKNAASIKQAAKHFGLSESTVKRYCVRVDAERSAQQERYARQCLTSTRS